MTASAVQHVCPMIVPSATMYTFCVNNRRSAKRWATPDECVSNGTYVGSGQHNRGDLTPVAPLALGGEHEPLNENRPEEETA